MVAPSSDTAESADRRTRTRNKRRDALYEAAIALFVEQGYDETTMDEVADRVDVARTTVFNYFPRKASFVDEWAARRRGLVLAAIHEDEEDAPLRTVLVRYFTELGNISSSTRAETVALIRAAVHLTNVWGDSPHAQELSRIIARAGEDGEIDLPVEPQRVGLLLASAYFSTLTVWVSTDPPPYDLTQQLIAAVDIMLNGLLPRNP